MKHAIPKRFTLEFGRQIMEVPVQHFHYWRRSRPVSRPEKHRFGPGWRQYMVLWMPPPGRPERKSVMVFYHGGAWFTGWPGVNPTLPQFFLQEGFPVIMPAYRLTPWYGHRHMREDLDLALLKTLELMAEKGWGDKKILLGGISAGATLAALLAYNQPQLSQLGVAQDLFSGFLSIGGPLDLDRMPPFRAVRDYAGGRPGSEAFRIANPTSWLTGQEQIPALLLHGTVDAIVPHGCSESFAELYKGPLEYLPMTGVSHLRSIRFTTDDVAVADVVRRWLEDK